MFSFRCLPFEYQFFIAKPTIFIIVLKKFDPSGTFALLKSDQTICSTPGPIDRPKSMRPSRLVVPRIVLIFAGIAQNNFTNSSRGSERCKALNNFYVVISRSHSRQCCGDLF